MKNKSHGLQSQLSLTTALKKLLNHLLNGYAKPFSREMVKRKRLLQQKECLTRTSITEEASKLSI